MKQSVQLVTGVEYPAPILPPTINSEPLPEGHTFFKEMEETKFEFKMFSESPEFALHVYVEFHNMIEMSGHRFLPDVQATCNKWVKDKKNRCIAIIQSVGTENVRCFALISKQIEYGKPALYVRDIIPIVPIMELPFRKLMLVYIKRFASENNYKVNIPDEMNALADQDIINDHTIIDVQNIMDKGQEILNTQNEGLTPEEVNAQPKTAVIEVVKNTLPPSN